METYLTNKEIYNLLIAENFSSKPHILDSKYLLLIDCRTKEEYDKGHIKFAKHHLCLKNQFESLIAVPQQLQSYDLLVIYEDSNGVIKDMLRHININFYEAKQSFKSFAASYPFLVDLKESKYKKTNFQTWPSDVEEGRLFIGTAAQAANDEIVRNLELTHIVNITLESPTSELINKKNILQISVDDESSSNLLSWFDKTSSFISSALKSNFNNRVLVHCTMGRSRSSTVVLAYLMQSKNISLNEASVILKDCRPTAKPNAGFIEQLLKFEMNLYGKKITDLNELPF